jgi:hypothetical protein
MVRSTQRRRGRLRSRLHPHDLDRALAAGVDPLATPAIAARARYLCSRRSRETLASAIYFVLQRASSRTRPSPAHVPIARESIGRNRAALLGLAADLRQPAEVCAQGVAITRLLVTEGAGPLYDHNAAALEQAVSRARASLGRG